MILAFVFSAFLVVGATTLLWMGSAFVHDEDRGFRVIGTCIVLIGVGMLGLAVAYPVMTQAHDEHAHACEARGYVYVDSRCLTPAPEVKP